MDSKETHRYAFELVKASRKMPVDRAEKQPHIQKIRMNYLQQTLRLRTNKKSEKEGNSTFQSNTSLLF